MRRNRRRLRRNARGFFGKLFRKNPGELFTTVLLGFAGFAGTKFVGNLIAKGIAKLGAGSSTAVVPAAVAPTAGLGGIDSFATPLGALIASGLGILVASKTVSDPEKRTALITGFALSGFHSVAMSLLGAISPGAKAVLAGDDTAVKLAAMYGFGGGTSIMPHYAPINGVRGTGEYLTATGEYFSGMGEYFESGVEGLGNYTGNPEIEQAAAGYGATDISANTNHIDPSSDLDAQLTIAEAAAGVGTVFQAAAGMRGLPPYAAQAGGMGEYFDSGVSGFGNVGIAPAANTWIPGMADGQLWAGTRPITQGQEATAQVPAGVLSSGGNQGVFG